MDSIEHKSIQNSNHVLEKRSHPPLQNHTPNKNLLTKTALTVASILSSFGLGYWTYQHYGTKTIPLVIDIPKNPPNALSKTPSPVVKPAIPKTVENFSGTGWMALAFIICVCAYFVMKRKPKRPSNDIKIDKPPTFQTFAPKKKEIEDIYLEKLKKIKPSITKDPATFLCKCQKILDYLDTQPIDQQNISTYCKQKLLTNELSTIFQDLLEKGNNSFFKEQKTLDVLENVYKIFSKINYDAASDLAKKSIQASKNAEGLFLKSLQNIYIKAFESLKLGHYLVIHCLQNYMYCKNWEDITFHQNLFYKAQECFLKRPKSEVREYLLCFAGTANGRFEEYVPHLKFGTYIENLSFEEAKQLVSDFEQKENHTIILRFLSEFVSCHYKNEECPDEEKQFILNTVKEAHSKSKEGFKDDYKEFIENKLKCKRDTVKGSGESKTVSIEKSKEEKGIEVAFFQSLGSAYSESIGNTKIYLDECQKVLNHLNSLDSISTASQKILIQDLANRFLTMMEISEDYGQNFYKLLEDVFDMLLKLQPDEAFKISIKSVEIASKIKNNTKLLNHFKNIIVKSFKNFELASSLLIHFITIYLNKKQNESNLIETLTIMLQYTEVEWSIPEIKKFLLQFAKLTNMYQKKITHLINPIPYAKNFSFHDLKEMINEFNQINNYTITLAFLTAYISTHDIGIEYQAEEKQYIQEKMTEAYEKSKDIIPLKVHFIHVIEKKLGILHVEPSNKKETLSLK